MLNPDLLNNKELNGLLLRSMKECELFGTADEIPKAIYKDLFEPIYDILGSYLKETNMLAEMPYLPDLEFDSWDEIAEIRYWKNRYIESQNYEYAAKLRDKEKILIVSLPWIIPYNNFLKLIGMMSGAENTYCMIHAVLQGFGELYVVKIEQLRREMQLLCSDKLLIELYNHHNALDRSVYHWQLAKWEKRKQSIILQLKIK